MATHNSSAHVLADPDAVFPSAEECVRDPESVAGRVAREAAFVEAYEHAWGFRVGPRELMPEEAADRLTTRLLQARSLIQCTFGEFGSDFRRMSEPLRENYLWAIADLIDAALGDALVATGLNREDPAARPAKP